MKKFTFRLDSVLTLRRHDKNQAAAALAYAQNLRIQIEGYLGEARQAHTAMENELRRCYETPSRGAEIIRIQDALAYQRGRVDQFEERLQEALKNEDHCREVVILARQREETILKLLEKEKEQYRRELDREDELTVVEFVNARHHLINAS